MQKIKFDFEATKQLIYAPNSTAPIGAPVDADGNVANDGTAIGIVLCRRNESNKYWVKQNLVVMVAGYCDIIDAQAIWGDEYSAEAMAAMSDITFCDNHKLPAGGGGGGGGDILVVTVSGGTLTEDETTTGKYIIEGATCDKTTEEIMSAKKVVVHYVAPFPYGDDVLPIYFMLPNVQMYEVGGAMFSFSASCFAEIEGVVFTNAFIHMAKDAAEAPLSIQGFVIVG